MIPASVRRTVLVCLALLLSFSSALAGEARPTRVVTHEDGTVEARRVVLPGETVSMTAVRSRPPIERSSKAEDTRVLVQLEGDPLARLASGERVAALPSRLAALDRLATDVTATENAVRRSRGLPPRPRGEIVRRTLTRVFQGLGAQVHRDSIEELRRLPGVSGVWIDEVAKATLTESVPLIRADRVWSVLHDYGTDVPVAIIDTGIDYTHPDFGGCIEPEPDCKIVFGWDLYNNDADPMDDNGHGTHVAGIVAADGTLRGVAPQAKLMAIKVLDAWGYGLFSDVIAGMDLAVDPDGNPNTADGAKIINMSLGGPGDPDDPVSQAVDNAVAGGTIVVVAAGNAGPDYDTVDSPGCARRAITVGASDKTDLMAEFSSRGPAPVTYQIKPEILAPGVSIQSTVPTGTCQHCDPTGYTWLDGTSMATPHVAGAAALVLARFPTWTPDQVRAALLARSVDLAVDAFTGGSGRLDAYAAATPVARVDAPNASLGLDDPGLPSFHADRTFQVTNLGTAQRTYNLSLTGTMPAGITTQLSPTSLTLAASQTKSFTFTLDCDNTIVPNVPSPPFSYEGAIVVAGTQDTLRLPFAMLKAPVLRLTFDEAPWIVNVHDRMAFFRQYAGSAAVSLLAPAAPIDVVTLYGDGLTWVVREDLALTRNTDIAIAKAEAAHTLTLVPVDKNGAPLTLTRSMTLSHIAPKADNFHQYVLSDYGNPYGSPNVFHLSPMTSAYTFEASILQDPSPGPMYLFHGWARDGVTGSLTFRPNPGDFNHLTIRHTPDPGETYVVPWTWLYTRPFNAWFLMGFGESNSPSAILAPFEQEAHFVPVPDAEYGIGYIQENVYSGGWTLFYTTPYWVASSSQRLDGYFLWDPTPVFSTDLPILSAGAGPQSWAGRFFNLPDLLYVDGNPYYHFLSQAKSVRPYGTFPYDLRQGGVVVQSGWFGSGYGANPLVTSVVPGAYELSVPFSSFHLGGQPARASVSAHFDTSLVDPNPPWLARFEIVSGGAFVERVPADGADVVISPQDEDAIERVSLLYQSATGYQELALAQLPTGEFTAHVPAPPGAPAVVPMTVLVRDRSGNSLQYGYCAGSGTAEACNGLDDDCDGVIPPTEVDVDGDLVAQCVPDCDDANAWAWATPGDVPGLAVAKVSTSIVLSWTVPSGGEAAAMMYDVLRSGVASDFVVGAVCVESSDGPNTTVTDDVVPGPGSVFFYLIRGRDACPNGIGTLGAGSNGVPRAGRSCP
jgi:hypothetical protein